MARRRSNLSRRSSPASQMQVIVDAANQLPGALEQLAGVAVQLMDMGQRYRATHWGRPGVDPTMLSSVADHTSGVVLLGGLAEIGYLTQKGRDADPVLYHHKFSLPYPILGEAKDGSGLVIVRGRSTYEITSRGIEG